MEKDGVTRIYVAFDEPGDVQHESYPVNRGRNGRPWDRHTLDRQEVIDVVSNVDCVAEIISRDHWRVRPEGRLRLENGSLFTDGRLNIDPPAVAPFTVDRPKDFFNEEQVLASAIEERLGKTGLTILLT